MITYERFKRGLIECLTGRLVQDVSSEEQDAIVREVEEKWWFCGGRDTRADAHEHERDDGEAGSVSDETLAIWERLWRHYWGDEPMPETEQSCVCDQKGLRYNCFVTDGIQVLVIGRVCLKQFLPQQARDMMSHRCEDCMKPHRNRKDNYCNDCRIKRKQEEEKRKQEAKEEEERRQRERDAELRERVRLLREQEEMNRRMTCLCGARKKVEYPTCWDCRQKRLSSLSEVEKKKLLCECGRQKKPQFATCFNCR